MMNEARKEHPQFHYEFGFPDTFQPKGDFDAIIVSDPGETVDLQRGFENLRKCCHRGTRLYVYGYNSLWEAPLKLAERWGFKMAQPEQNWLTEFDFKNLLELAGFEVIKVHYAALLPVRIPLISWFYNHVLAHLPGLRRLCLIHIIVARPVPEAGRPEELSVSVVVPCRNEEGNIEAAVKRIPALGSGTEIIFCDDKSTDTTRAEIERMMREYPEKNIRLVEGPGICKSKNVWVGFDAAENDILMILDADLTVMPEELPRFLDAIASNRGEFINGSRLVYPIPREAMKVTNRAGNVAFSWLFSLLLGQRIKDTLCGTKVIRRSDWLRMRKYVDYWGVSDLWGDYDLLLGAAKLNLRIVDLPVHYQERIAGVSKMTRVLHNAQIMLAIMWKASVKMRRYGSA
ncbi:MAG: glycosyltransferase family 2 protein, partial [Chthoniobacterales bacterium]|nr:glycosyltransferase family 2 protein [Chthoniobacterales bacterium]